MLYDLSATVPFVVAFVLLAVLGVAVSAVVVARELAVHHRTRLARHQSIPTYYRRLVLAH